MFSINLKNAMGIVTEISILILREAQIAYIWDDLKLLG